MSLTLEGLIRVSQYPYEQGGNSSAGLKSNLSNSLEQSAQTYNSEGMPPGGHFVIYTGPDVVQAKSGITEVPITEDDPELRARVVAACERFIKNDTLATPDQLPWTTIHIVSNRLPITIKEEKDQSLKITESSGGLQRALNPILRVGAFNAKWYGWAGIDEHEGLEEAFRGTSPLLGYDLISVNVTKKEKELYYDGFINSIIWPLQHDMEEYADLSHIHSQYLAFRQVNMKFVREVKKQVGHNDFIWIQDNHLTPFATEYRADGDEASLRQKIGIFYHTPHARLDTYSKLPGEQRIALLRDTLQYDFIGYQIPDDVYNYVRAVQTYLKEADIKITEDYILIQYNGRTTRVNAVPISIDYNEFAGPAQSEEITKRVNKLQQNLNNTPMYIDVFRSDFTKGAEQRFDAYEQLLRIHTELQGDIRIGQVVIPNRLDNKLYRDVWDGINSRVNSINSKYSKDGWIPIYHLGRSVDLPELLTLYRSSDYGMVGPLKDGMNLVAKEYVACARENGVMLLSRHAGAAYQLQAGALLIEPRDPEMVARTMYEAYTMPNEERVERMRVLKGIVQQYDVHWWAQKYLGAAHQASFTA